MQAQDELVCRYKCMQPVQQCPCVEMHTLHVSVSAPAHLSCSGLSQCLPSLTPLHQPSHLKHCPCLQDEERTELLQMSTSQLGDVARVCGRYPDIQLEHSLPQGSTYAPGDTVTVDVELQRSQEGELPPVDAPR